MEVNRTEMQNESDLVRSRIQTMGKDAVKALLGAAGSIDQLNKEHAHEIIEGDAHFNELYQSIHDQCLVLIARHQPVAKDLREIIAELQIAIELERIADHIVAMARIVPLMTTEGIPPVWSEFMNMIRRSADMMERMLMAHKERDPISAETIAMTDEDIDRINDQIVREVLQFMKENDYAVGNGTHLIWLAHHVERICDRITNIGEQIVFITSGKLVDLNVPQAKYKHK